MAKTKMIRWVLRLGIWAWVFYWISGIFWKDLGASPALSLNHEMGEIALILLTGNLLLGILLDLVKPTPTWLRMWILERRFWGVSSFFVLFFHVGFYFLNEGFELKAWTQVYTKNYLIFGALAFTLLAALAVTSNNWSIRVLKGKRWKHLHRLVYLAQFFILIHLLLIEKADLVKYSIWVGGLCLLQASRWIYAWIRQSQRKKSSI
jgi:sulfoxide reductase heme-binding subunit YedZ